MVYVEFDVCGLILLVFGVATTVFCSHRVLRLVYWFPGTLIAEFVFG